MHSFGRGAIRVRPYISHCVNCKAGPSHIIEKYGA